MSKLSPQAQAVKDAVLALYPDKATQSIGWPLDIPTIAAALRAAADQVVPTTVDPRLSTVRSDLMRIAAELEALPDG
jgi:hypothetical protein